MAETSKIKIQVYNAISFASLGMYDVLYCSPHWIFAMKYWIVSYKLSEGKMIKLANFCYYFVLILNIAISVFVAVEEGMDLKLFDLAYSMLIWIQVFSCFVLADGCRRFYVYINKKIPTGVNNRAVSMHVGVYMLYLIGLFYFYFAYIKSIGTVGKNQFLI